MPYDICKHPSKVSFVALRPSPSCSILRWRRTDDRREARRRGDAKNGAATFPVRMLATESSAALPGRYSASRNGEIEWRHGQNAEIASGVRHVPVSADDMNIAEAHLQNKLHGCSIETGTRFLRRSGPDKSEIGRVLTFTGGSAMSYLDVGRRRFNMMLTSIGLMLPGTSLFAAPPGGSRPSPMHADVHPELLHLTRNDWVPNNDHLPVLLYRNVIRASGDDPARAFETTFDDSGWPPQWRAGVYTFHHYHSTAHEVLGFVTGHASLMLGGPNGHVVQVNAGDVAVLPTGTGHCNIGSSDDFLVVGAYPPDQQWDICRGPPSSTATQRMQHLAFPDSDPVTGPNGPLTRDWIRT